MSNPTALADSLTDTTLERVYVSALLAYGDGTYVRELLEACPAECITDPRYRTLAREVALHLASAANGAGVDIVALGAAMAQRGQPPGLDGSLSAWLGGLVLSASEDEICRRNPLGAAKLLAGLGTKRRARSTLATVAAKLGAGQSIESDLVPLVEAISGADGQEARPGPRTYAELSALAEQVGKIERIGTAFPGLDAALGGGYARRWLCVFGAFTGGGKTTACVRESLHKASLGHPVLYLSFELAALEVRDKLASGMDGDPAAAANPPIWVEDGVADLDEAVNCAGRWADAHRSDLVPVVVVDYLQRVRCEGQQSREREVAVVSETFQRFARERNVLVLAAAQLNRLSQESKPAIHHLRESGLLEQAADIVLLLSKPAQDRMSVVVGKNRWGRSGDELELGMDYAHCRVRAMSGADVYAELAAMVLAYISEHGSPCPARDFTRGAWWSGRRPRVHDVAAAAKATGLFSLHDGRISLPVAMCRNREAE